MKILEVRRHTMRQKPGAHLSQQGIALANGVGSTIGPFDLVVTSTIPRAIETAIAMGFEVNEILDALGHLPKSVYREIGWPSPFTTIARAIAEGGQSAKFAGELAHLWTGIIEQIDDGQQALIITHGGFIELGAVASLPGADHSTWGDAIGYCEGVRLSYGSDFICAEILRVPESHHQIEN